MQKYWENTSIDLRDLTEGEKINVSFQAKPEMPGILKMVSSCGCSSPAYNKTLNRVVVNFRPGNVPVHLKEQGWYETMKTITILHTNGDKSILKFNAKIYGK